jgi:hypothetical protein
MIWFGSSAGVAITNLFPEARSVGDWIKGGWHVMLAYVAGFAAVMLVMGWHPHAPHKGARARPGAGQLSGCRCSQHGTRRRTQ